MADTEHLGHVKPSVKSRSPTSYQGLSKDFALCYSNSVLKPLLRLGLDEKGVAWGGYGGVPRQHNLGFVRLLVDEIETRHQLLKADAVDATERGVVQMSFSCIHAWLRAAAAEILPAEAMARAAPFDQLQGGWLDTTPTRGAEEVARRGQGTTPVPSGICGARGRVGYCVVTNSYCVGNPPPAISCAPRASQTAAPHLRANLRMSHAPDCARDHQGSWPLTKKNGGVYSNPVEQCHARCRRCANCRFVSISQATSTCHWFTSCTLGPLQTAFGADTNTTFQVRKEHTWYDKCGQYDNCPPWYSTGRGRGLLG